jgi:hypothetical protein
LIDPPHGHADQKAAAGHVSPPQTERDNAWLHDS